MDRKTKTKNTLQMQRKKNAGMGTENKTWERKVTCLWHHIQNMTGLHMSVYKLSHKKKKRNTKYRKYFMRRVH